MKSALELDRLLLKFILLSRVDVQESSCKIWESKGLGEWIFQAFKEPKIQNFGNHGATSMFLAIQRLECMEYF